MLLLYRPESFLEKKINYKVKLTLWQRQREERREKQYLGLPLQHSQNLSQISSPTQGDVARILEAYTLCFHWETELSTFLTWAMVKVPGEPDITQRHSALSLEQDFQQVFQLSLPETQQTLTIGKGWPPHPSCLQQYSQHNAGCETIKKNASPESIWF